MSTAGLPLPLLWRSRLTPFSLDLRAVTLLIARAACRVLGFQGIRTRGALFQRAEPDRAEKDQTRQGGQRTSGLARRAKTKNREVNPEHG